MTSLLPDGGDDNTPICVSSSRRISPSHVLSLHQVNTMEAQQNEPLLLQLIRHSLSTFPVLELAIEQGMGGPQAREKQSWMASVVHDFLVENQYSVADEELSEYIEEILNNEFDTIVEDSSVSLLARRICHYCSLQIGNSIEEMTSILVSFERTKPVIPVRPEPAPQAEHVPSLIPIASTTSTIHGDTMDVDDKGNATGEDGWTVVQRGRSRRNQ